MGSKELLAEALKLKLPERFALVEGLLESLDKPDAALDEIWAEEAEKRLQAYRQGRITGVDMETPFRE
ncbi:addiction module protein [Marinospirillum alkaliphilum]|uniref:Putative addiction module component, TIGR02574 family n=1 Tax=Marinospirillum alkaliphilum DSM 21637 TaxID=1122209 RepID=A0A1K1X5M3_9GAMM|nr:addiction module protein [Marinospirillum alkaliphilum]SFX44611.1 putative addiction module component, TIGR02574 family [Marinospirillum alkaliphilum DSM 21637]